MEKGKYGKGVGRFFGGSCDLFNVTLFVSTSKMSQQSHIISTVRRLNK